MSISSLDETTPAGDFGHAQSLVPETGGGIQRSASSSGNRPSVNTQAHGRSTSLGGSILDNLRRREQRSDGVDHAASNSPMPSGPTSPQPSADATVVKSEGSQAPVNDDSSSRFTNLSQETRAKPPAVYLKPHIVSPTADEFLLVTGTSPLEPGIGMFVNLDGDPTRPTIEFDCYPKEIVSYSPPSDEPAMPSGGAANDEEGYIFASITKEGKNGLEHGLEIQGWDAGSSSNPKKFWLQGTEIEGCTPYGIRLLSGEATTCFSEIIDRLCLKRFVPFPDPSATSPMTVASSDSRTALSMERVNKEKELFERDFDSQDEDSLPEGWDATRTSEEEQFVRRLAVAETRMAVWSSKRIWWVIRNPLIIQLDSKLEAARPGGQSHSRSVNKQGLFATLVDVRGREPTTELDFMTLSYTRQKAGVLLLASLLLSGSVQFSDSELSILEEVLIDSKLDPRVVLSLIPGLRNEIIEGRKGIWVYGGVKTIGEAFLRSDEFQQRANSPLAGLNSRTMHFLRHFLTSWRKMKGFGSIADEHEVFRTVDAALLLVLLELDQHGRGGAVRVELEKLVDRGVDCFERAVSLLESYHRLFVLSRLYQSRKMAADVLATWKRIIEGETDSGDEQPPDEQRVRGYLKQISSQPLVKEYGIWLANRNPKLGVEVFAEDDGRSPKFEPSQVVEILKEEAPNAVKYYLEHLVFAKGHTKYVNDLIAYYLDVVIGELESSASSREIVQSTYEAYRALEAPKPAYSHFLTDNAPPNDEMWHSRLRLLQLLGANHDYDSVAISRRIETLPQDLLVPETIILSGKAHRHEAALRLLVHKLGDYDTAVSYCIRGGSSIYVSQPGRRSSMPSAEQQRSLFNIVFREMLSLADVSDRIAQTSALLERFGEWFEIDDVLSQIPDHWSVEIIAGFLVGSIRRLVREKHESIMTTALSTAQNLRVSHDLITRQDQIGPQIEATP